MSLAEGEGEGGEPFPPIPPWGAPEGGAEEAAPPGDYGDPGSEEENAEAGLGVPFFATDPRCWESDALKAGAVLELTRTDPEGLGHEAVVALFAREVQVAAHGAWVSVRFLGATTTWAAEWAVKTFSREKKRLHVCRHGSKHCKVIDEKGYHVWEFFTHVAGTEPPPYVGRPKRREWQKLYEQVMRRQQDHPPGDGVPGAGEEAVSRVAKLKERLMRMKEGGDAREPPAERPPLRFGPEQQERRPAIRDRPIKKEAPRQSVIDLEKPSPAGSREKKARRVRDALADAAARAAAERKAAASSSRRGRSRSRRRRRRSKNRHGDSKSSDSGSRSSSSSSMVPPLQRKASRNPGSVMKLLMDNVSTALAQAAVTDLEQPEALGSSANQVGAYFQIVAKPQLGSKVRDCRELETLARCLDLLRMGKLPELGDSLAGRFLAVESAGLTNNWADAQHLEVIPVRHTGLAPPSVMLQAQRHTRQVEKAAGRKPWQRSPGPGTYTWGNRGDAKGDPPAGKGDVRGRGKGGRKGGGKAKGAWKDKEKTEGAPDGAGK